MITKAYIDKRICDTVEGAKNTQTWKEFIRECEDDFGLENNNLDTMTDKAINEYIDWLDYLCEK